MSGDERTKYCATCRRSIPNLSLMSAADRAALGEKLKTERVCGSFYMRLTGEMVTLERPLTMREKNRVRQFGVAALSASALAMATGCMAPHATTAQANPATASISVPSGSTCPGDEEEIVLFVGMFGDVSDPPEVRGPPSKR
jgi:hypothetical protein